jgi:hypothetical protein
MANDWLVWRWKINNSTTASIMTVTFLTICAPSCFEHVSFRRMTAATKDATYVLRVYDTVERDRAKGLRESLPLRREACTGGFEVAAARCTDDILLKRSNIIHFPLLTHCIIYLYLYILKIQPSAPKIKNIPAYCIVNLHIRGAAFAVAPCRASSV